MSSTYLLVALWLTSSQGLTPINSITQIQPQTTVQIPETQCLSLAREAIQVNSAMVDQDTTLHGTVSCITINTDGTVLRRIPVYDAKYAGKKPR